MLPSPLVTVIIPCYNYGRFLNDALESVLAQTYGMWECLVVDDGSKDNTREVATRFVQQDDRFRYLIQENSGVSAARNTALKEANGTYIQLLDADDLIEKDKLALQVAYFDANEKVDLIYSNIKFFKDGDRASTSEPKLLQNNKGVSGNGETLLKALVEDNIFLPGCVLFRKSLYQDVGLFKKGIEGIEDWDYFYRAALLHKTFHFDARAGTCLLSRNHGNNASGNNLKMLKHKIIARKALMQETKTAVERHSFLSHRFVANALNTHKALLNRDGARLNLFHGNVFAGVTSMLKHAYYSQKPYFAFYDGVYWLKERVKKKLNFNAR
jgi:glycosyltransferase involved in cell wall biosynthesis